MLQAKSDYVAMAEHLCPVCGDIHSHDTEILLHKRLQSIPKDKRLTGVSPCKACSDRMTAGFIACVVAANRPASKDTLKVNEAERTGDLCWVRGSVFADLFDVPVPAPECAMVFIDSEVFSMLQGLATNAQGPGPGDTVN